MPALRVIHYSPGMRLALGGVVRAVLDCCSVLANRGQEMTLVGYEMADVPQDWTGQPGKPKLITIPMANRPNGWINEQSLSQFRSLLQPSTVVHLHTPWTASNAQIAKLCRDAKIPYIVSMHGMLNDWPMRTSHWKKRFYLRWAGRKMLRNAAYVHFTAQRELEKSRPWIGQMNPIVLPCLLDLDEFSKPTAGAPRQSAAAELLFLGRLHEQKGVDILLEAVALIRDANQPAHLTIAGSGSPEYESQLRDQITRLKISDRVTFVGSVAGDAKRSLFQGADIFVHPSRHDNFAITLVEAVANGTPVVTTQAVDTWPDIQSAGGIVIEESAPQSLARAITPLLADPTNRKTRGQSARNWVMENWSAQALAPKYEAMYASATSGVP